MITLSIPLRDVIIDPEDNPNLLALPKAEAIALLTQAYAFLEACQYAPVNAPPICTNNVPLTCTNTVPPICGHNAPPLWRPASQLSAK